MLVLSRKKNQKILIADGLIEIIVVDIRGDKVRLGITAPKDISVHREEVATAIRRYNEDNSDGVSSEGSASDCGGCTSPRVADGDGEAA